jgi:cation transport ATPase
VPRQPRSVPVLFTCTAYEGFNGLFIPVAALGYLTPLAAALLMLVSSTGVLLNSLRLTR